MDHPSQGECRLPSKYQKKRKLAVVRISIVVPGRVQSRRRLQGPACQGRPPETRASGGLSPNLQEGDPAVFDDELADGLHFVVLVDVGALLEVAIELEPVALAGSEGAALPID